MIRENHVSKRWCKESRQILYSLSLSALFLKFSIWYPGYIGCGAFIFFFYKRRNVNFLPSHLCAGNHDHALVESHPLGIALRKNCPLWSTVYTSESQQPLYLVNTSTTKTLIHNCEHNYTNNSRYTEVISQALSHLN